MSDSESSQGPLRELTASRARFVAELGERVAAVRLGLARLAATGGDTGGELNAVRRRVHALAAAADVLHFASAAEALSLAEAALATGSEAALSAPARERVGHILDLLPSLVLGAPIDVRHELDAERHGTLSEPLCVVVWGDAELEATLHRPGPLRDAETHSTRDPALLRELVGRVSPDAIVLDADDAALSDVLPPLRQQLGSHPAPLVAVGSFERHEHLLRLVRRGVTRVLPKPLDSGALQRVLRSIAAPAVPEGSEQAQFRRLTADEVVLAIAAEARKAFGDAGPGERARPALELGSGAEALAALWGAFARIRGLAALAAGAAPRHLAIGPNGAIPLAPLALRSSTEETGAPPGASALAGRRIVVAAADASVRALLGRCLDRLGAVVLRADSGSRALEIAESHWPDAVLADSLLPELDGFALSRRLHRDIALFDMPVALITWRDDVLDCARRDTAARDTAARDTAARDTAARDTAARDTAAAELDPRSIEGDLALALEPRSLLERRLAEHPRAQGRLDGISPRLLLTLACDGAPSGCSLSLHSGSLRFELTLADGTLLSARAYDGSTLRAEGAAVLAPLLGLRSGRFAREPLPPASARHFRGDLMAVLAQGIAQARRARELVESDALDSIDRVVLDPLAVVHVLQHAPGSRRALIARLQSGAAPRTLGSDPASRATLIATLLALAQAGAIRALVDTHGRDRLDSSAATLSEAAEHTARAHTAVPAHTAPEYTAPAQSDGLLASAPADSFGSLPDLADVVRYALSRTPDAPLAALPDSRAILPASPRQPADGSGASRPPRAVSEPSPQPAAAAAPPQAPRAVLTANAPEPEPPSSADHGSASPAPPHSALAAGAASDPGTIAAPTAATHAADDAAERDGAERDGAERDPRDDEARYGDSHDLVAEASLPLPVTPGARARAVVVPLAVTFSAASLAFLAVRAVGSQGWETLTSALRGSAQVPVDAGGAAPAIHARPAAAAQPPATAPASASGEDAELALERRKVPVDVVFDSELLELPTGAKLRPGQGLLEVRTWERQRIYVDGVFMGNYEARLIPLVPGTYQVQLRDGSRHIERSVEVRAGQRTRLSARPKSAK